SALAQGPGLQKKGTDVTELYQARRSTATGRRRARAQKKPAPRERGRLAAARRGRASAQGVDRLLQLALVVRRLVLMDDALGGEAVEVRLHLGQQGRSL